MIKIPYPLGKIGSYYNKSYDLDVLFHDGLKYFLSFTNGWRYNRSSDFDQQVFCVDPDQTFKQIAKWNSYYAFRQKGDEYYAENKRYYGREVKPDYVISHDPETGFVEKKLKGTHKSLMRDQAGQQYWSKVNNYLVISSEMLKITRKNAMWLFCHPHLQEKMFDLKAEQKKVSGHYIFFVDTTGGNVTHFKFDEIVHTVCMSQDMSTFAAATVNNLVIVDNPFV